LEGDEKSRCGGAAKLKSANIEPVARTVLDAFRQL